MHVCVIKLKVDTLTFMTITNTVMIRTFALLISLGLFWNKKNILVSCVKLASFFAIFRAFHIWGNWH